MPTFRSTVNAPGQMWDVAAVDDGRVRCEPVSHMGKPTSDGSNRALVVSRRAAESYFGVSLGADPRSTQG